MGIKTKQLRELTNPEAPVSQQIKEKIYPITHEKAVIDDNGNTLDNKLATIIEEAADAATATITPLKNDCIQIKNDTQTLKEDTQNIKTAAETSLDAKIAAADLVYDVSAHNPTAGPNSDGKFTLEYILSQNNVDTLIPTTVRKGGMSIKFVQSSDNKYVQARCMAQNFTTDVTKWQVVDGTPNPESHNLAESGGVAKTFMGRLFDNLGNSEQDVLYKFFKNIKVYNLPTTTRFCIFQVWKNVSGTYRLFFTYYNSSDYIAHINLSSAESHITFNLPNNAQLELLLDWSVIEDGQYEFNDPRTFVNNIIALSCYDTKVMPDDFGKLEERVGDIEGNVISSYTSDNVSDFTSGKYLPRDAEYYSVDNLISNGNLCYKIFEISSDTNSVFGYSGFGDNYPYESIFFIDNNNKVLKSDALYKNGKVYTFPTGTSYICVCFLKNYEPFGVVTKGKSSLQDEIEGVTKNQINNELSNYLNITGSHQERTLRDFCYETEKRTPFEWNTFNKKWFAFMNDDGNSDMGDYYKVCRDRRVPYCHAYIIGSHSQYTYNGNDADRTNLIKNPAIGQSYTFSKLSSQTYLRLYIDRQYNLGFPITITVNGTSHTISTAENARISIGNGTSVTFTINSIGELTDGRTEFINIIATASSTDSDSASATWSEQQILRNIVFDFGEILSHDSQVINMYDPKVAESLYAKYLFYNPRKIDEILGEEHCKGAILPGGPNSERGMNTVLGQHYCCRYILYADYYGTTPQYMIRRYSYSSLIGSATVDYATAKANALQWLSDISHGNGFYPLFTHSEKTPTEVCGVIDAILEYGGCVCSNWRKTYDENS